MLAFYGEEMFPAPVPS